MLAVGPPGPRLLAPGGLFPSPTPRVPAAPQPSRGTWAWALAPPSWAGGAAGAPCRWLAGLPAEPSRAGAGDAHPGPAAVPQGERGQVEAAVAAGGRRHPPDAGQTAGSSPSCRPGSLCGTPGWVKLLGGGGAGGGLCLGSQRLHGTAVICRRGPRGSPSVLSPPGAGPGARCPQGTRWEVTPERVSLPGHSLPTSFWLLLALWLFFLSTLEIIQQLSTIQNFCSQASTMEGSHVAVLCSTRHPALRTRCPAQFRALAVGTLWAEPVQAELESGGGRQIQRSGLVRCMPAELSIAEKRGALLPWGDGGRVRMDLKEVRGAWRRAAG